MFFKDVGSILYEIKQMLVDYGCNDKTPVCNPVVWLDSIVLQY